MLDGAGFTSATSLAQSRFDNIFLRGHIPSVAWEVEYTNEFEAWWIELGEPEQIRITASVELLEERGPSLPSPFSSGVNGSVYDHMRELRVQIGGDPYRIFYAFDPRRMAILLIGGNKAGDDRFYEVHVPLADKLYAVHLQELAKEGLIK